MLRLGPPATLINHQNGGFEKKKQKKKNALQLEEFEYAGFAF